MEDDAKRRLKAAELQAKKDRLRIWTNYVPPVSNSKAIHDQNFSGKVLLLTTDQLNRYVDPSKKRNYRPFLLNPHMLALLHFALGCRGCQWRLHNCC